MLSKSEQLKDTRLRKKKCKTCKEWFRPVLADQLVCMTVECSVPFGIEQNAKKIAKEKRESRQDHNKSDNKWLLKEAQRAFNTYIRKRDEKLPCVSCGYVFSYMEGESRLEGRQRQAGHLKPEAKNALLRFNEDNVHAQCNHCNDPFYGLKGNVGEYEKSLRVRIGEVRVDELFQPKVIKKWTNLELQTIIETYKTKTKELNGL